MVEEKEVQGYRALESSCSKRNASCSLTNLITSFGLATSRRTRRPSRLKGSYMYKGEHQLYPVSFALGMWRLDCAASLPGPFTLFALLTIA